MRRPRGQPHRRLSRVRINDGVLCTEEGAASPESPWSRGKPESLPCECSVIRPNSDQSALGFNSVQFSEHFLSAGCRVLPWADGSGGTT